MTDMTWICVKMGSLTDGSENKNNKKTRRSFSNIMQGLRRKCSLCGGDHLYELLFRQKLTKNE